MRTIGKKAVFHLLILCLIVTLLFPIYIMLTGAFKSAAELATNATGLPQSFSFVNFDRLLRYNSGIMVRTYLNSIFVTVVYTVLVLFLASLAAFAFSKYRFRGKNVLFFCLLATMMIPTELTIAPLYIVFSRIHWLDTYIVQIIPGVGNVFAMFLFKQYMDGIPSALVEAARIDGCGHFRTYLKIMLPITKPIIGALTILVGLGKWNDYLWPTMMINKTEIRPIMAVLPYLNEGDNALSIPWELVLAGCTLVSLPLVIIFFVFQNQFMQSVTIGAVKE